MTGRAVLFRLAQCAGIMGVVGLPFSAALGSQVIKTNWVERWVTNVVEVRMQANRFVNEYQTNWIEQATTNFVRLYATNRVTEHVTNHIVVDVIHTNFVTAYHTNNMVVDLLRTNLVSAYHTNLKVLNLTNWTTVVAFKTNWVAQPVTNVVEIVKVSIIPLDFRCPMSDRVKTVKVMGTNGKPRICAGATKLELFSLVRSQPRQARIRPSRGQRPAKNETENPQV